jgi:hypothetical protein
MGVYGIVALAVTGEALSITRLEVLVNVIDPNAFGNVRSVEVGGDRPERLPVAECGPMIHSEDILVENFPFYLGKGSAFGEVFNVGVGRDRYHGAMIGRMLPKNRGVVGCSPWRNGSELEFEHGNPGVGWGRPKVVDFSEPNDCSNLKRGCLSRIYNFKIGREWFAFFNGHWGGHQELKQPRSFIHSHSLAHDIGLGEVGDQYENGNEESGSARYRTGWLIIDLFHVIFFSLVGVFLAQRFLHNWRSCGLSVFGLFLFALMAMSAAHVEIYLFKLMDVIRLTL